MHRRLNLGGENPVQSSYVQFGAAACAPKSWTNFDISPTLRLQRIPLLGRWFRRGEFLVFPDNVKYGDIIQGLPIAPGTCAGIYCAHVLEHLALNDMRIALRNTHQYLRTGGIFRFVLPDLERLARNYLEDSNDRAAMDFMEQSYLGTKTRPRGLKGFVRSYFGNSSHLWMWDFKSMTRELKDAGFIRIRRAEFGDCEDDRFRDVEELQRWEGCLGIECRK